MKMNCLPVLVWFLSIYRKSAASCDLSLPTRREIKTLCIQLFSAGIPSDALLIYRAKMSSFDAACYIDIQLVCGAALETTKASVKAANLQLRSF